MLTRSSECTHERRGTSLNLPLFREEKRGLTQGYVPSCVCVCVCPGNVNPRVVFPKGRTWWIGVASLVLRKHPGKAGLEHPESENYPRERELLPGTDNS